MCGGREDAYLGRVTGVRRIDWRRVNLLSFSLEAVWKRGRQWALSPSDTLDVSYSKKSLSSSPITVFPVTGAFMIPCVYPYYVGMTVKDLILLGGGFRADRFRGEVRLERRVADSREIEVQDLKIDDDYEANDLNLTIRPFDRLVVPFDPNWYTQEVVHLNGAFKKPGEYALAHSGERLSSLLKRAGGYQSEAYLEGATFYRHVRKMDLPSRAGSKVILSE